MTAWRKSSYSGYNGNCAEVAVLPTGDGYVIGVRDSKDPGPVLEFAPAAWTAFLDGIKAGAGQPTLGSVPVGLGPPADPAFSSAV